MNEYVINRPDEDAMERILAESGLTATGTILRLAWHAGLLREEIVTLTWAQIDLVEGQIRLPERLVPIGEELRGFLSTLREERRERTERVVLSDRDGKALAPQSVSRLARAALDRGGQEIRLIDLRHDFVLRQLAEHDWQYVSRISGVESAALNAHFGAILSPKRLSTRIKREQKGTIDEFRLWQLLQSEGSSPAAAAILLTWQMGLKLEEITVLRWEAVGQSSLRLPGRTASITPGAGTMLAALRQSAPAGQKTVLAAPRSQKPFDRTRLSRLVRAALIRGGMDNVTLRDLRQDCTLRSGGEGQILQAVKASGFTTRAQTAALLGVSPATAYRRLKQMAARNKLSQIGGKYYLYGAVVPAAEQASCILQYLAREGFAYRQDLAQVLRIDPKQCRGVLKRMVAAGEIVQEKQKYLLG